MNKKNVGKEKERKWNCHREIDKYIHTLTHMESRNEEISRIKQIQTENDSHFCALKRENYDEEHHII